MSLIAETKMGLAADDILVQGMIHYKTEKTGLEVSTVWCRVEGGKRDAVARDHCYVGVALLFLHVRHVEGPASQEGQSRAAYGPGGAGSRRQTRLVTMKTAI
jgi:hypothetical protein